MPRISGMSLGMAPLGISPLARPGENLTAAAAMQPWQAAEPDVAALLGARHGDPFAVLGPHRVRQGVALRVLLPGADRVEALLPGGAVEVPRRDPAGFFEVLLPAGTGRVPLRATADGTSREFLDPYGFGATLGPLDDHLLLEGTHDRLADRLGAHPVEHEGAAGT